MHRKGFTQDFKIVNYSLFVNVVKLQFFIKEYQFEEATASQCFLIKILGRILKQAQS